ncbi:MAG: ABC transporter permease protein NatB [Steroidobacteraceae bacterium]|nr:ABC transporter permease protein NatB [Steroidobacteraceae bacterium]
MGAACRVIATVWRKEVRENLRDRRTLVSALLFGPLFGPLILAAALQFLVQRTADEADQRLVLAVRHAERAPNLMAYLEGRNVEVTRVTLDDAATRRAVRERTHPLVLSIPEDFAARLAAARPASLQLYSDASASRTDRDSARAKALIGQYGASIGRLRLQARGVDPLLQVPLAVQDIDVSTPQSRSVTVLGMLSYLVLLAMILGGLYLAIDATAGERERHSLEPLLTTPVPREHLIYGKILAAATFMLLSLVLTVIACAIALRFVQLENFGMTARLDAGVVARIILATAPLALAAAALLTVVASFTRSYREAQTWLGIVMLVPTLPIVFVGLADLQPSHALMAVPSLGQHFLITALLRGDPIAPLDAAVSSVSSLALGVALALLAGRLYRRESLLG